MEIGRVSQNSIKILLLVLLAVGVGAYYWVPYRTKSELIVRLEAQVEKLNKDVREIENRKKELDQRRTHIAQLDAEIDFLEKAFPEELFIPKTLFFIESLANATNISINSINPSSGSSAARAASAGGQAQPAGSVRPAPAQRPVVRKPGQPGVEVETLVQFDEKQQYRQQSYNFEIQGVFSDIYNFFGDLASFPKLVVIDEFTLQAKAVEEDSKNKSRTTVVEEEAPTLEGYRKMKVKERPLNLKMPLIFYVQTGADTGI